jgi:hypothetical protein
MWRTAAWRSPLRLADGCRRPRAYNPGQVTKALFLFYLAVMLGVIAFYLVIGGLQR